MDDVFGSVYGTLVLVVLALGVVWYVEKRARLKREGKAPKPFKRH